MKNQKLRQFALFTAAAGMLFFQSCSKSSVDPNSTTDTTTANATTGGGTSTTTNVAVTQANLLAAITTYLNTNYSGYTFTNAYSEANTAGTIVNYDVNIVLNSVKYHVVFDAAGAFVSVGTGGGHGAGTTNVAVTQANLLAAISTYLTTNYAGYTFTNAYSEANAAGTIVNYDVNIVSNSVAYHVVFDAAGAFVSVNTGGGKGKGASATTNVTITQASLLANITTYLTTNYSGYTFINAYSEANASNVIVNYDVNITSNGVNYHVVFDATGTFVSVVSGTKTGGKSGH